MKKKMLISLAACVMAMAIGSVCVTVSRLNKNLFNANLEALSSPDYGGGLKCHPLSNFGDIMLYNGIICLNDKPGHCAYPHSYRVYSGTQDCLYAN